MPSNQCFHHCSKRQPSLHSPDTSPGSNSDPRHPSYAHFLRNNTRRTAHVDLTADYTTLSRERLRLGQGPGGEAAGGAARRAARRSTWLRGSARRGVRQTAATRPNSLQNADSAASPLSASCFSLLPVNVECARIAEPPRPDATRPSPSLHPRG